MSHWHFITRKQPELHMLPERVGNSDFSQNQLLVDMVKRPCFNKNNFLQWLNKFWNSFLAIFKVLQLGFTQSFQVQIGHRLHEHGNTATCQFGYLKQLIIYHIWWVKTPIRHGKLLASPDMLKGTKRLFQLVSLLDAFSFLNFLLIKFTKPHVCIYLWLQYIVHIRLN